ncbi:unnamed protein product [Brassica napus]|uniref:(rape) hypothetical protein n=1 Tax=Brassica napus TaxID=3708 RepID=A0A816K2S4_BRANA|nr:unnamed protein product [Brassica napus]
MERYGTKDRHNIAKRILEIIYLMQIMLIESSVIIITKKKRESISIINRLKMVIKESTKCVCINHSH